MARDLVAMAVGVDPDSFELTIEQYLPPSVREHLDEADRLREEAATAGLDR